MIGLTYLVYDFLYQALLVLNTQPPAADDLGLQHDDHDWVLRRGGADDPVTPRVQLRPHRPRILAQLCHQTYALLRVSNQIDGLACRCRAHSRQRRAERVCRRAEPLMLDDLVGASAEAARGAERASHTPDDHVHVRGVDVLVLGEPTAGAAEDEERGRFVEDEAVFVALFQVDDFGEVGHGAGCLERYLLLL